ncbi:hypothetical protein ASE94_01810 [Devosia sp. Leaf64]|nr:hypothetical protein ASE94_01810 [Devosia sp. Leaf64]
MYMPTESLFGGVCNRVRANGWTVLPQSRKGKRLTSVIDGEALKWGPYIKRMPTTAETARWGIQARTENAAILLGPSSGNVFAIDIDVLDVELSYSIQELSVEILGATPYRRTGMHPKIALLYRAETEEDLPSYKSIKFMSEDRKQPTDDGIEILGAGRMMTAYGYHHKTSQYFKWYANQPISNGPQDVPVATLEQLEAFFDAVQDLRHAYRHASAAGAVGEWIDGSADGIVVGKLSFGDRPVAWVQNSDGKIVDGRDEYLWTLTKDTVKRHAAAIMADALKVEDLRTAIRDAFRGAEEQGNKSWPEADLRRAIVEKTGRAVEMLKSGRIKPRLPKGKLAAANDDGKIVAAVEVHEFPYVAPQRHVAEDDTFAWLTTRRETLKIHETKPDPVKAAERRLNPNRQAEGEKASAGVAVAINAFFDDVIVRNNVVHVLNAPTGVGKSATIIREIVKRPELLTVTAEATDDDGLPIADGPMLMLVPSYNNVDELRERASSINLDPSLPDDELEAQALEMGVVHVDQVDQRLGELRSMASAAGLISATYKGKIAAGCAEKEKVALLQAAGISSSQLCQSTISVKNNGVYTGEKETVYCEHYATCPAILQRKTAAAAHIVFMVRNFLTLAIPEELANPKGVILDERVFDQLVKSTTFQITSLDLARRPPRLTKKEEEAGLDPYELLQLRDHASALAQRWIKEGKDLATAFHAHTENNNGIITTGPELAAAARRVCGQAMTSQAELSPNRTLQDIQEMCSTATGTDVAKEYRMWCLVEEGIEEHRNADLAGRPTPRSDRRIQLLDFDKDDPKCFPWIRISWGVQGNWASTPTLLLDASTDEELVRRTIGVGREVKVHKIEVSLNQRVAVAINRRLSSTMLFPSESADINEHVRAAQTLADLRLMIATYAAVNAHGRVVIQPTKKVRRLIQQGWVKPRNVDFGHLGATAGLDYAKGHVGSMTLGRIELPVREIDGIVAALSHEDDLQEVLIDSTGTGLDEAGNRFAAHVTRRTLKHRDGSDISFEVQQHAGPLAHAVQKQYREEQLRQGTGRIRPVYREVPAAVIMVAESVPDDVIVDEVIAFEDLAVRSGGQLWDAVRLSNGFIEAHILAHCAPHLGDIASFEKQLAQLFFGVPSTVAKYHKALVRLASGEERSVYAPAHDPSWFDELVRTLEVLGWSGEVEVAEESKLATFAVGTAPMDDIEYHLAKADQEAVEMKALHVLQQTAIAKKVWRKVPRTFGTTPAVKQTTIPQFYALGEGDLARKELRMDVWMMLTQMKDAWALTGVDDPFHAPEKLVDYTMIARAT